MYPASAPVLQRSPDEDDRLRRDAKAAVNTQQLPSFNNARSPTQYLPYSPTNGTHPQSPYNNPYSSRPSTTTAMAIPSGISPRLGPPPSPKSSGPAHGGAFLHRESSSSTFYDPTSEHREGQTSWTHPHYPTHSPVQV